MNRYWNIGNAVNVPWFRRRKPYRRYIPVQSDAPVCLRLEDVMKHAEPTMTPHPPIPNIGSSETKEIDTVLMDKKSGHLKFILKQRTVVD